ncbi:glycosyltransferase [Cognatiyoonia sp. IB215182]|uniref:glycosyltransferase n=1 Tax=Cognatiyoonia sp. IB215182 TaxID=3097353 RepID=UPI002A0D6F7B|nr:glycosyltransferase [Cognatiyoonia sp. IB215182]MDX8353107.1 glycosyltransferase [Cognatiyoonia sp. IB215182]
MNVEKGRLLIYAPVPLYGTPDNWMIEAQAANGLRLWAENFDRVTIMMPHLDGPAPTGWIPADEVGPNMARVKVVALPTAWVLPKFARVYRPTRNVIRAEIAQAEYLSFAIGGLIGDWGAVACLQAHKMGRPYGVWTDRVESQVTRSDARSGPFKSRIKKRVIHRPMAMLERWVIKRATVGLFHGQQTFDAYARYCRNPQIVHDIHVSRDAHISNTAFKAKLKSAASDPLKIVYAGRANAMKGPLDWASALQKLAQKGVNFEAHWLGDGPQLDDLRKQLQADGLSDRVTLHGFVNDPAQVAAQMQAAHVFLFCHKTPESPRCLIESLIAATPIVGYEGSYAADLIGKNQGGHLVPIGDTDALGDVLFKLAQDRSNLANLIQNARKDGVPFDDESVFAHRSDLIKRYLGQRR